MKYCAALLWKLALFEHKEATMSLLHSFTAGVLSESSFCLPSFFLFSVSTTGNGLPAYGLLFHFIIFIILRPAPSNTPLAAKKGMTIKGLFQVPLFWVSIILMICAGASELSMAQWASAYTESALGFSKTAGDLIGPCMFAITMGISRVIFGKYGDRLDLMKFMAGSGFLCLLCYLTASISANPVLGLVGCILCGFSVGIMWPGTISICSRQLPAGGTAMFALLAMAGDLGGAFGPGLVGAVTQRTNDSLKTGMLMGSVFPLILILSLFLLSRLRKSNAKTAT